MTPSERIAKAHRASSAWDEFVSPMLTAMREEYRDKLIEEASVELNKERRTDKVTALAQALRVLNNLENGMREAIRDGELAQTEKLRADKIMNMTDAQQRLLKIGAGY